MDVVPMLEQLRLADSHGDKDKALESILKVFLDPKYEELTDDMATEFSDKGLLEELLTSAKDQTLVLSVAQVMAEVAKTESVREPCVEKGFVPIFLRQLERNEDISCITQSCRALGNMCFDNDIGRGIVDDNNGIDTLLSLLRSLLTNTDPDTEKLRTIACGFLLNLTNSNESLQEKAIAGSALDLMAQYLQKFWEVDGLCNMVLVTVASLTDTELCKEKLLSSPLCSTLVDILKNPETDQHYEAVLDILITLSEWDEVKDMLANTDLCHHLIRMAQVNLGENAEYSEDSQQLVKMASDLLILLLTGEKSMDLLFDSGKGEIFTESLKWLESKEEHLQLSGALAMGNFARSDEHCRFLVEHGVVKHVLTLIRPVYGQAKSTLEHAALSALRNLAIPASNKGSLINEGVIEAVLVLVESESLAVIYKMLGVLRMLVDGQDEAALRLGQDREFTVRLSEWSACDEHAGVKGEATRLMAWIIKNSRTIEVMRNIIRADGIHHLVAMATAEHVLMQNEALIGLTLIASTVLAEAAVAFRESDLTDTIQTLLKDEKTLPEILCNTLTLTKSICTAASSEPNQTIPCSLLACTGLLSYIGHNLREELVTSGIAEAVKHLCDHEDDKVKQAAKTVISHIEELPVVER